MFATLPVAAWWHSYRTGAWPGPGGVPAQTLPLLPETYTVPVGWWTSM
jgi:hypothetical protein